MIITFKPKNNLDDWVLPNITSQNASLFDIGEDTGCWKVSDITSDQQPIAYDPEVLNNLHILTVFIVSFLGALLILLLLVCACLSNETVTELLCKKKLMVNKGIEGYFPFVDVGVFSLDSTSPSVNQSGDIGKKDENQQPRSSSLLSPDIPILIELCDATVIAGEEESIPLRNIVPSNTSDNASGHCVTFENVSENPRLVKKVEFVNV